MKEIGLALFADNIRDGAGIALQLTTVTKRIDWQTVVALNMFKKFYKYCDVQQKDYFPMDDTRDTQTMETLRDNIKNFKLTKDIVQNKRGFFKI